MSASVGAPPAVERAGGRSWSFITWIALIEAATIAVVVSLMFGSGASDAAEEAIRESSRLRSEISTMVVARDEAIVENERLKARVVALEAALAPQIEFEEQLLQLLNMAIANRDEVDASIHLYEIWRRLEADPGYQGRLGVEFATLFESAARGLHEPENEMEDD